MPESTETGPDTVPHGENLTEQDVVWMGAPSTDGGTDPSYVRLFATRDRAEEYVESLGESSGSDREWEPWDGVEGEGRRLVEAGESVGAVGALEATVPGTTPPFEGSTLERIVPSDSRIRSYLPLVSDRPAVDRETLPVAFLDMVLFSERGHLELRVSAAPDEEAERCLDELRVYAGKAVDAAIASSDDRIARSRIQDVESYFRVEDGTAYYGKPRYRLAKRLSEWGGETSRYAVLELWLLYRLVLRLYPDHVSWEPNYEYHDEH